MEAQCTPLKGSNVSRMINILCKVLLFHSMTDCAFGAPIVLRSTRTMYRLVRGAFGVALGMDWVVKSWAEFWNVVHCCHTILPIRNWGIGHYLCCLVVYTWPEVSSSPSRWHRTRLAHDEAPRKGGAVIYNPCRSWDWRVLTEIIIEPLMREHFQHKREL